MRDIDLLPTIELVRVIQEADAEVAPSVAEKAGAIAQAIDRIAERLASGGRLFYVGAGTSGRIALLDAAELPPTFGVPEDLVQVILAGGPEAFLRAREGAEDRVEDAVSAVRERASAADAVVGVAASGTTPFTVAALREAKRLGALTVAVACRPETPLAAAADLAIEPETGEEVVMGSTRMKAGTAQKLVLNTLSTGVMVRLGHTYGELMVDMPATNEKLRRRTLSMVAIAAGVDEASAEAALRAAGGEVKTAILAVRRGLDAERARTEISEAGGDLRRALGEKG